MELKVIAIVIRHYLKIREKPYLKTYPTPLKRCTILCFFISFTAKKRFCIAKFRSGFHNNSIIAFKGKTKRFFVAESRLKPNPS